MGQYTEEETRRLLEESRHLLEELSARTPYEPAAEEAIEAESWQSGPSRNDDLIRYGIKLDDPHALEKYREEAAETERKSWRNWIAHQEHRKEVEQLFRKHILAERRFLFETLTKCFDLYTTTEQTCDEIADQVGELRDELNMQREHAAKFGEVIDLPSPLIRKVKDNAA
jgi:hypothetical protein